MKYYTSLLESYGIPDENIIVKSPWHIDEKFGAGVKSIVKFVNNAFSKVIDIKEFEKKANKLLIIMDKDNGEYSPYENITNQSLEGLIYQTNGYSFENDFVSDEALLHIQKELLKSFNVRNQGELEDKELHKQKELLNDFHKQIDEKIGSAIESLNQLAYKKDEYILLKRISKYNYKNEVFDFIEGSEIRYKEKISKDTIHGKSAVEILLGIMREDLRPFNVTKPIKNVYSLMEFLSNHLPAYWKSVFDSNDLHHYK